MGLFSFIENFFFLSLGILVILIVLLIYHFKQRMSSVEKKGDTMYELLTNVVQEMNILKRANMYYESLFQGGSTPSIPPPENKISVSKIDVPLKSEPEIDVDIYDAPASHDIQQELKNKIVVSDGSDSETDYESGDESDNTKSVKSLDLMSDNTSVYSDSDKSITDADDQSVEEVNDLDITIEYSEPVVELEEPVVEEVVELEEPVVEEVVAEEEPLEEPIKEISIHQEEPLKIDYKKMNIHQLKSAAITFGITSDTSKMKKAELIKLLESKTK